MADPLTTLGAAARLWRIADDVGLLKRVANFFKKKERIVVLGSTGSGKTNMLDSLAAAAALVEPISAQTRTTATDTREILVNDRPFVVIDTPGQQEHAPARQRVYREALAKPPVRVINVVSFGYHEYATGSADALDRDGQPREDWLMRHRENELLALQEWLGLLGDRSSLEWVLTAVTKADLWWDKKDEVLDYYTNGAYADALRRSDPGIQHAVLPYCSVFHRFYGKSRLPGTFDDQDRLTATRHFLEQLVVLG